jgi:peptide methionine sulfoxide reductase msrA/msrB
MKLKTIYLAGGCFWGIEEYMSRLYGIYSTNVGYANGNIANPTYKLVCSGTTFFAETVRLKYDEDKISLGRILEHYFTIIDPTSVDKQGGDVGNQYRTGIYYEDENDIYVIEKKLEKLQRKYDKKIMVECKRINNYYSAEDYHQNYLKKNPNGYCHINLNLIDDLLIDMDDYTNINEQEKVRLNQIQINVTKYNGTELPFSNEFWNNFEKGIYVDIVTKEPLFLSKDKFESSCGWPSFSKPIIKDVIKLMEDTSHGMNRIEVRSRAGDNHLGHVFEDGKEELGGLRFCINSASLEFIKLEDMELKGYGYIIPYV